MNDYGLLSEQLKALTETVDDNVANMANAASLLFNGMTEINWAGFYILKNGELILGPFMGQPACVRIQIGKGVCGTAAEKMETVVVPDVHEFPGHIACDSASRSEIVIPLVVNGSLFGVMDIDSPVTDRFDEADRTGLEAFARELEKHIIF